MKTGYDQFFKDARKVATKGTASAKPLRLDMSREELVEKELRSRIGVKTRTKKKKPFPWKLTAFSFLGLLIALYGFQNYEKVEKYARNIEISLLGPANASEKVTPKAEAKKDTAAAAKTEPAADGSEEAKRDVASDSSVDHLQKLIDRKKELDVREEELNRLEQELQVQKAELEKRMKELEEMRSKISTILDDKVKADEQKIDSLVQMYSSMRAPQAAKIFETMDEDLAVEILGRMKKKNAADIMNLLKAEKAQSFSEKFAGYKRK